MLKYNPKPKSELIIKLLSGKNALTIRSHFSLSFHLIRLKTASWDKAQDTQEDRFPKLCVLQKKSHPAQLGKEHNTPTLSYIWVKPKIQSPNPFAFSCPVTLALQPFPKQKMINPDAR